MERDRVYLPKNPSLPTVPSQLATLPCFFAILESSFDGIFITNGQAVPIWVNHSYEVISGLSARDVLGIPMDELVRRGLISNSATLQALEIGHSYTANQSFVTGKQALVTSTPIYDENDQVCLVVTNVRDISELVSLQETLDQQRRLSSRYQQEIEVIRNQLLGSSQMVAEDPATLNLLRIVGRAAQLDTVILIQGETGAGKERIASYIHQHSPRARKNFIRVNCGAIPESLAESELFGYERGAFTGANREGKAGLFEVANEGTIFLDEVGGTLPGHPNQAPPGPPGAGTHPGGGQQTHLHRRPGHRRHQPGPAKMRHRGHLPGGPLLPPQRLSRPRPAPAGAEVGHSQTGPLGDRRAQPDL